MLFIHLVVQHLFGSAFNQLFGLVFTQVTVYCSMGSINNGGKAYGNYQLKGITRKTNSNKLVKSHKFIGRLIVKIKHIGQVKGYTQHYKRIYQLRYYRRAGSP